MKVFARIKDGKITEYPVYEIHIKNRNHPNSLYLECVFDKKPNVPEFHYLTESKSVENNKVYIKYKILPIPLEGLLKKLNIIQHPGKQPVPLLITDVRPELTERIITLTKEHVQSLLDKFAAEKGFDDMSSLVSYKDSTIPEWASQATTGIAKRDATWSGLYVYLNKINTGVEPLPTTIQDIMQELPSLVWE
jgi:hypothetical protein